MNYNMFSKYVVIFWAQNQATVIHMGGLFSLLAGFASAGTDQQGREWSISTYSPFMMCGP